MADSVIIDVPVLLRPLSPEHACGDNLEYDPVFRTLEEALAGKPEVQYGDTIAEAQSADWKTVRDLALQLFERSRDLRVALGLARPSLQLDGIAGFAAALALVQGLLDECWDSVHPQLDPEDGNDPTVRVNTIAALVDEASTLRELRQAPLIASRAHGRFSLRDIELADGEQRDAEGAAGARSAVVEAACMDIELDVLRASRDALRAAHDSALSIEETLTREVGAGQSLDLSPLARLLKRMQDFIDEHLARRDPKALPDSVVDGAAPLAPAGAVSTVGAITGEIGSREDVLRTLDRVNAYYDRHEPSSPVPLLLRRAQRLVNMRFVDIVRDMAPDALEQLCKVGGIAPDSA